MCQDPLDLIIIIPLYNEESIITHVVTDWHQKIQELDISFAIHIFNDGSTDQSLSLLHSLSQTLPELVIHDKINEGHGPTLTQAYKQLSHATWIFQVDSDNEINASFFTHFWKQRHQADFLVGRRHNRSFSLERKITSVIANQLFKWCFGKSIADVNCPYRLFKTQVYHPQIVSQIPNSCLIPNIFLSSIAQSMPNPIKQLDIDFQVRKTGTLSLMHLTLLTFSIQAFYQYACFILKKRH